MDKTYEAWDRERRARWPEAKHDRYDSWWNDYHLAFWNQATGRCAVEPREIGHA